MMIRLTDSTWHSQMGRGGNLDTDELIIEHDQCLGRNDTMGTSVAVNLEHLTGYRSVSSHPSCLTRRCSRRGFHADPVSTPSVRLACSAIGPEFEFHPRCHFELSKRRQPRRSAISRTTIRCSTHTLPDSRFRKSRSRSSRTQ